MLGYRIPPANHASRSTHRYTIIFDVAQHDGIGTYHTVLADVARENRCVFPNPGAASNADLSLQLNWLLQNGNCRVGKAMRMVRDEHPVCRQYIFSDLNFTDAGDVIHVADDAPVANAQPRNPAVVFLQSQKKGIFVDDNVFPNMNIVDIPQLHGRDDF